MELKTKVARAQIHTSTRLLSTDYVEAKTHLVSILNPETQEAAAFMRRVCDLDDCPICARTDLKGNIANTNPNATIAKTQPYRYYLVEQGGEPCFMGLPPKCHDELMKFGEAGKRFVARPHLSGMALEDVTSSLDRLVGTDSPSERRVTTEQFMEYLRAVPGLINTEREARVMLSLLDKPLPKKVKVKPTNQAPFKFREKGGRPGRFRKASPASYPKIGEKR